MKRKRNYEKAFENHACAACVLQKDSDALLDETPSPTETAAPYTIAPVQKTPELVKTAVPSNIGGQNAASPNKPDDPSDPRDILDGIVEWAAKDIGVNTSNTFPLGKYFASESAKKLIDSYRVVSFSNGALIGYVTYDDKEAAEEFVNEQVERIKDDFNYYTAHELDAQENFMFSFVKAESLMIYYQLCLEGRFVR